MKGILWLAVVLVPFVGNPAASFSQPSLDDVSNRLTILANFADRICGASSITGSGEEVELTGEASAQLRGLVKSLVDAGLEGAAKYQSGTYETVLREDLKDILIHGGDCRSNVIDSYKSILFPAGAIEGDQSKRPSSGTTPNKINATFDDKLARFNANCGGPDGEDEYKWSLSCGGGRCEFSISYNSYETLFDTNGDALL